MKIAVLSENHTLDPKYEAEYGLSVYIEQGETRLLFDTGNDGACQINAERMGIDLGRLTAVAFSHNHRDHCGGFLKIAGALKPSCPIYAHTGFFRRKWWDHSFDPPEQETYAHTIELVGPPMEPSYFFSRGLTGFRLIADDIFPLGDGIYLLGNFALPDKSEAVHPSSIMEMPDGSFAVDTFRDEQICAVETAKGLFVLTGCAHKGICNILGTVRERFPGQDIFAVLGGTHLVPPDMERIKRTARMFAESTVAVSCVCHCTGDAGLKIFKESVPSYVETGSGFMMEV